MKRLVHIVCRGTPPDGVIVADVVAHIVSEHLCVHRGILGFDADEEPVFDEDGWVVTHIPTGFIAARAYTKKDAIEAAEGLLALVDWSSLTPESVKTLPPDVTQAIHNVRRRAYGLPPLTSGAIAKATQP